ncbi:hypothetical protein J6590_007079 [Homalodisca vitripennis]|nr:hypothetical protein J6590_007079 [Homalodisca vitripennis]
MYLERPSTRRRQRQVAVASERLRAVHISSARTRPSTLMYGVQLCAKITDGCRPTRRSGGAGWLRPLQEASNRFTLSNRIMHLPLHFLLLEDIYSSRRERRPIGR